MATHSEKVADSRRFILDLLLSNHKLECFSCGKRGLSITTVYALDYGIDVTSFTEGKECLAIKKIPVIHFSLMIQKSVSCVVVVPVSVNCGREEMYLVLLIVALKQNDAELWAGV